MNLSVIYDRAADIIEPQGCWTQRVAARGRTNRPTSATSPRAVCWCMLGAIDRAAGGDFDAEKEARYRLWADGHGTRWNDARHHTQAEVVAVLRAKAEECRRAEQ